MPASPVSIPPAGKKLEFFQYSSNKYDTCSASFIARAISFALESQTIRLYDDVAEGTAAGHQYAYRPITEQANFASSRDTERPAWAYDIVQPRLKH